MKDLKGDVIGINIGLSEDEYGAARALIKKYVHLFAREPEDLQEADMPLYTIYMKSDKPATIAPYRLSSVERIELDRQMEQLSN